MNQKKYPLRQPKILLFGKGIRTFVPRMEKIRVNVVGLHHNDVRDDDTHYAATAVGKKLVLQPEPENVKDPYAVRAREGTLTVGYVAVPDLDVVYQALAGSGHQRLRGVVIDSNAEPPILTVEAQVEAVDWHHEPFDDSCYEGWRYDGLPLMPPRLQKLGDLTADLTDALEELPPENQSAAAEKAQQQDSDRSEVGWAQKQRRQAPYHEVVTLTRSLLKEHLYDPSREMTRARYRLERLLAARPESELQEYARQLRHQKGMLMRHVYRDEVARYLFITVPRQLQDKGLERSHYTYDNRLDALEAQLRAFPWQLYDKFLSDPVDFLREVYYKHVPRRYLFPLLSGIVLMVMKGRADIARWGREGATEPIQQIASFRRALTPEEREAALKDSIRQLLDMKDPDGTPVMTTKNQWAAIISVLTYDYQVRSNDLTDMCHKMDEWGFGKESGYKCYCDYECVAKCSQYATNPYRLWNETGTARNRQDSAASALRTLLHKNVLNK